MIIMIDISEMRRYLLNEYCDTEMLAEIYNTRIDNQGEERNYLEWIFRMYFKEMGYRVISFVLYEDYSHSFKNKYSEIISYLHHHMNMRANILFNLNKESHAISLMISYNTLIISVEGH